MVLVPSFIIRSKVCFHIHSVSFLSSSSPFSSQICVNAADEALEFCNDHHHTCIIHTHNIIQYYAAPIALRRACLRWHASVFVPFLNHLFKMVPNRTHCLQRLFCLPLLVTRHLRPSALRLESDKA